MKNLLLLGVLPFFSACHSEPVEPEGMEVIITDTHLHSRYCGHYIYDGHWYYLPEHKHGVDCGHEQIDGLWTLVD